MLRVVQTAAWDWAPPHMSGYPHLSLPRHRSTRRLMPTVNPSNGTTKTRSGPPIRRCRGAPLRLRRIARRRGAPHLPCPMARSLAQRASRLSFNRRRCSAHSPMWHKSRRCVGGCGTNPIVRSPLRLSMRGLYGAKSMWTPGLVCPMFCTSVAPLVFPQDPQETGETRDDQPQSIRAEGSGAGAMEWQQLAVLGVLHACFFVASRGCCAPCCACPAFCAFYMSCPRRASGGQTSRRSRFAEASPGDQR